MIAGMSRRERNGGASLPRRFATALCLLAVLLALFGHVEPAPASALIDGYSVLIDDHAADAGPDHGVPAAQHHCLHSGHCAFHAILPISSGEGRHDVTTLRSSLRQHAKGRTVTPWHRPPSTTDIG